MIIDKLVEIDKLFETQRPNPSIHHKPEETVPRPALHPHFIKSELPEMMTCITFHMDLTPESVSRTDQIIACDHFVGREYMIRRFKDTSGLVRYGEFGLEFLSLLAECLTKLEVLVENWKAELFFEGFSILCIHLLVNRGDATVVFFFPEIRATAPNFVFPSNIKFGFLANVLLIFLKFFSQSIDGHEYS